MADPAEHPSGSPQTEADAVRGWIRYWVGVHDQEAALRSLDNALAAARREGETQPLQKHAAWCWLPLDHQGQCEGDQ